MKKKNRESTLASVALGGVWAAVLSLLGLIVIAFVILQGSTPDCASSRQSRCRKNDAARQ